MYHGKREDKDSRDTDRVKLVMIESEERMLVGEIARPERNAGIH